MDISPEFFEQQIPYYLTKNQKEGLLRALKDFPANANYYLNGYYDELLQGDGWTKLKLRHFETGERQSILGIILSNTCDTAPENRRDLPVQITFAPLIPVSSYIGLLEKSGVPSARIQDKVTAIKEQKVSNVFFLPSFPDGLKEDHIALLDRLFSMPATAFNEEKEKAKVFTLSLIGFYIFLFKLSVHFCRFGENVQRE